jgi:hypothetical protein
MLRPRLRVRQASCCRARPPESGSRMRKSPAILIHQDADDTTDIARNWERAPVLLYDYNCRASTPGLANGGSPHRSPSCGPSDELIR